VIHEGQARKIIVGDSDRTVLELLQIRLDLAGYHACVARTGSEVLETLRYHRPAAMILDTGLAQMNAFEVLEFLWRRGERPNCPILVTGRKLSVDDVQKAIGLGATLCLAKPFSGADMLDRVAHMLRPPRPPPVASPGPAYIEVRN